MNLFVDSNIYLDFYQFSSDDLDELMKLVDLISSGEINLIVTTQVINEVKRNRDKKVADSYKIFLDSKFELYLPQICKSYSEYSQIKSLQESLKRVKGGMDKKLVKDIKNRTLKADKIINLLFETAKVIESDKYINKAKERFDLGNPPGKNHSYGDSLNWISLVEELETEDLYFISDDKDFKSALDEYELNYFLLDEWRNKKSSTVIFYTRLSNFLNKHYRDIQLRVEEEKNILIEKLRRSSNFENTHRLITELSKFVSFTDDQVNNLANIAVKNSQVYWILRDPDVKGFYNRLLENKEHILEENILNSIKEKLQDIEISFNNNDLIPF